MRQFLILLAAAALLQAVPFSFITKENNESDPTLLVVGGIHGNEPGGYFAAALLSQYYTVEKGNLWIIPDLNRASIQRNRRGINGDMNRKFAVCKDSDPDHANIDAVKKIITDKRVSLILNLHDGHGFYREKHEGTIFNPRAWGQTCVIDQCNLDKNLPFGDMDRIAREVSRHLNNGLIEEHHSFNVKNTQTKFDDEAMQHSLTYFAVTHNKPAFAIETSKHLSSLAEKVFYQLNAIEAFMKIMGITYSRTFSLNRDTVSSLLTEHGKVLINNKISLNLNNIRKSLSFIPLESNKNTFVFTHPLGSVKRSKGGFVLYIGNQEVTRLRPEHFNDGKCAPLVTFDIDGSPKNIKIGSGTYVNSDFRVKADENLRVNVIGYTTPGKPNENGSLVRRSDLNSNFSIDSTKRCFRVELYNQDSFCGMVTVHFK
ncbi:MAG: M99 family carboxypeptidase catalytic domain-containing protein [Sulfurimonadaceae bacterium]|nr:M99 family carboxypeptidase catalytic domain-containing protein [Sulfurimonadaceae bacterium]